MIKNPVMEGEDLGSNLVRHRRRNLGSYSKLAAIAMSLCLVLPFQSPVLADGTSEKTAPRAGKIMIVGLDSFGHAIGREIPLDTYRQVLSDSLHTVDHSMREALKRHPKKTTSRSKNDLEPDWSIRSVGVGISIFGEFALEPLMYIGMGPTIRLIFTNSLDPIYPE